MPGLKTNEVEGTRAVLRHYRMSATKARQVLDIVRGEDVDRAQDILRSTPREGARVVSKVLASATANARHNDGLDPDELFVSACYADEGTTAKRWRPRARGRATRIRKRTCHITVIVSRLPEERLERKRSTQAATVATRSRRVAASRRGAGRSGTSGETPATDQAGPDLVEIDETETDVVEAEAAETDVAEADVTEAEGGEAVKAEGDEATEADEATGAVPKRRSPAKKAKAAAVAPADAESGDAGGSDEPAEEEG